MSQPLDTPPPSAVGANGSAPTEGAGAANGAHVAAALEPSPSRAVELPSGYALTIRTEGREELEVRSPEGRVCLRIRLTSAGPEVEIEAASVAIASRGPMNFKADELTIDAEKALTLRTGGDLKMEAKGHIETVGFTQAIVATHGDVHVEANDDVRVDGERVRLNAPDAAPIRRTKGGSTQAKGDT